MTPPAAPGPLLRAVDRGFALLAGLRRAPGHRAGGVLDVVDPGSAMAAGLGTGRWPVVARLSRGIGLPPPLPDVLGIALRTPSDAGPFDLLMTSVGPGRLGSWVLFPSTRWTAHRFSTLLPYVGPRGRVVIGLRPAAGATSSPTLEAARAAVSSTGLELDVIERSAPGPWRVVGRLRLDDATDVDAPLAFDPVLNAHPALHMAPFLTRVREAAYAGSRRGRGRRRGRPS